MERGHMHALGHPHRAARLLDRDLEPEAAERLDEHAHRRQLPVVDHGTGPVEHDRPDMTKIWHRGAFPFLSAHAQDRAQHQDCQEHGLSDHECHRPPAYLRQPLE